MLGDQEDRLARWMQGIFAILLLPFGLAVEYYDWTHMRSYSSAGRYGTGSVGIGAIYLGWRCLWYAITGENNINRDDF